MRYWTPEQARAFLQSVTGDRLEAAWRLLLATGLRRGEALGLKWADIELDAGKLSVRRTLVAVGYSVEWSTPEDEAVEPHRRPRPRDRRGAPPAPGASARGADGVG
jgi:integrase